ncbi:MAG: 5-(carboxyamino)imidazole ribonucleotide mutase [Myxococcota bacterium]|jgi:5-(carboxyamino)imidazole ribonucleotide mutase
MSSNFVPIIMGSLRDKPVGDAVAAELAKFGIDSAIRVASAHKAPKLLFEVLGTYEADSRSKVYVTIAGRSNALSAVVDANVQAPVIACPPYSDRFGGGDIFSSLRMPSGIAPVVIIEPAGAALAAVKMLALADPPLREAVAEYQRDMERTIRRDDATLNAPAGTGV